MQQFTWRPYKNVEEANQILSAHAANMEQARTLIYVQDNGERETYQYQAVVKENLVTYELVKVPNMTMEALEDVISNNIVDYRLEHKSYADTLKAIMTAVKIHIDFNK